MIRQMLAASLVTLAMALPASAFDLSNMTDAERAAFRDEVRAYLLENPEVLMEAIAVLEERQNNQQVQNDRELVAANADELFKDENAWVGGNPEGDVTIVEFMDYRCSFCRKAHPEVEALIAGDPNIRLIVKEYPILGPESVAASRFAMAVRNVEGDEAYKKAHDALITLRGAMTEESFRRVSDDLGLDTDAVIAEMANPLIETEIQRNYRLAERMQISGTPSFVFESELVRGYVPLDTMQAIVAELRKQN